MTRALALAASATLLVLAATGCQDAGARSGPAGHCPMAARPSLAFDNASFYTNGKFNVEKGKDAIIALMQYHGYPVYPGMRENLWVSDYGTGQFTKVGLAARMWKNNEADHYMLMDLFILPGQMLPEHWHLAFGGLPAKREGWLVRYGSSHIVGEGAPNLGADVVVPKAHNGGVVTVQHEEFTQAGGFQSLCKVESHHWQLAGPEGAIITEVANVHADKGVRHLDPGINKQFLGE